MPWHPFLPILYATRGAVFAALLAGAGPVQAQWRLPGLPSLGVPALRVPASPPLQALVPDVPLQELRLRTVRDLLQRHRDVLEADPAGEAIVRAELMLLAPSVALVEAAQAEGFRLLRTQTLEGLELRTVVLQAPAGLATAEALARLRAIDPTLEADFNHLYTRSGSTGTAGTATLPAARTSDAAAHTIGLVDGGLDARHPSLRGAALQTWGCRGAPVASSHGTAVASLLVDRNAAFSGRTPEVTLYAADVYCDQPSGGAADAVAEALAWMARERVPVINVSLVGPANRLLGRAVQALVARGHLVVAAVGNDGPAAPPLYPAAYAEVVGVTGVTAARRVLPEAAQGPQVSFAAPGADLPVAQAGSAHFVSARGTSFAAPLVAGLLATLLHAPDAAAARRAVAALASSATDLGTAGRDTIYGWGLVGEQQRVALDRVPLQRGTLR